MQNKRSQQQLGSATKVRQHGLQLLSSTPGQPGSGIQGGCPTRQLPKGQRGHSQSTANQGSPVWETMRWQQKASRRQPQKEPSSWAQQHKERSQPVGLGNSKEALGHNTSTRQRNTRRTTRTMQEAWGKDLSVPAAYSLGSPGK